MSMVGLATNGRTKIEEAVRLQGESYCDFIEVLGFGHVDTKTAFENLSDNYEALGGNEDARKLTEALEGREFRRDRREGWDAYELVWYAVIG